MTHQPMARSRAHQGAGAEPATRVGILTGGDGSLGTAALLLEVAGLATVEARSVTELQALVRDSGIAAVVVDPELGDGWAVETAETVAAAIGGRLPVMLLCRHAHDAQVIQQRVAGPAISVLLHEELTAEQLATIIKGAIAAQGVRPKAVAPS